MGSKYFFLKYSTPFALFYWIFESTVHFIEGGELEFEILPSEFHEIWMRSTIFILILFFGIFADYQMNKIIKAKNEKEAIQKKLEDALSKTLSEFIPNMYKLQEGTIRSFRS